MSQYGLLIDYDYCTGCHACEIACKQEYKRPAGRPGGIRILDLTQELPGGKVDVTYFPLLTRVCSFCKPRVKKGLLPACVQHCMARCLTFGPLEEMSAQAPKNRKAVLWTW